MKKTEEVGVGDKEGKGGIYTPVCKWNKNKLGALRPPMGAVRLLIEASGLHRRSANRPKRNHQNIIAHTPSKDFVSKITLNSQHYPQLTNSSPRTRASNNIIFVR